MCRLIPNVWKVIITMRNLTLSLTKRPLGMSRRSFAVQSVVAGLFALAIALNTGVANAQEPTPTPAPGFDFAALATSGKTELNTALGSFMPVVIGIFITLLGIGLVWSWSKKSVKSA